MNGKKDYFCSILNMRIEPRTTSPLSTLQGMVTVELRQMIALVYL